MSDEDKTLPQWGFNQRGLWDELSDQRPPERKGLSLGGGVRFRPETEMDKDLHPFDQDCPRAYRKNFGKTP